MEKITVTSPLLPPLDEFAEELRKIWDARWITNNGIQHQSLEQSLCQYLKVPYLSLFTNGTLPLITALQALKIKGEVITTPYSFVATTHALWWNGLTPVFVDVDPMTGNMDPQRIEEAITPNTSCIMPVHVYGTPCDIHAIQEIADRHHLKVIYDAAHAFGVEVDGKSILCEGDLSTLSFHATKVYNTVEGGAMIMHDKQMKRYIDYLKNFGFAGETEVVEAGINSKMDEVRSAFGLLNLRQVDAAIARRRHVAEIYREQLADVPGLRMLYDMPNVKHNYSYFPIFIDAKEYGTSRDILYDTMSQHGVYGRRYFYPLISQFAMYRDLPSATYSNIPVAHRLADSVICLPIHHALSESDIQRVVSEIKHLSR